MDWQLLNFLQPLYMEDGTNGTLVNLGKGNCYQDKRKVKTILKQVAKQFAVDLSAAKANYGRAVGRKDSTPIPMTGSLVLLPVKMRLPVSKDDGSWGYVVLEQIAYYTKVDLLEYKSKVTFKDGSEVFTLLSTDALYALSRDGELVKKKHLQLMSTGKGEGQHIYEAAGSYLQPSCSAGCILTMMGQYFSAKSKGSMIDS